MSDSEDVRGGVFTLKKLGIERQMTNDFELSNREPNNDAFNSNIFVEKNEKFNKEAILYLDSFFDKVLNKHSNSELLNEFSIILEKYSQIKEMLYLCLWLPFIESNEELVIEILKKQHIQFSDKIFTQITDINNSTSELNTYSFNIAIANNFNSNLIHVILMQGKIRIKLEWLLEQLVKGNTDYVQTAWEGGNDCYFSSQELKLKFLMVVKEKNKDKIQAKKSLKGGQANLNSNRNSIIRSRQNTTTSIIQISKSKFYDVKNVHQKEFASLINKGYGKITMMKLLLLVNSLPEPDFNIDSYEEQNKQFQDKKESLMRAVCLFDVNKKQSNKILEGLYLVKKKKICSELLEANLLSVDINVFRAALHFKDMKFALHFYNLFSDFKIYDTEQLHLELIDSLKDDILNIEVNLFFIKKFSIHFKLMTTKEFLKAVEDFLAVVHPINKTLHCISNPIKIFVLIAEILKSLKSKHPTLEYNITRLIDKSLEYSLSMQNLIEEDSVFREIILDKDTSNRTLIEIISENDFLVLLKNSLVEKIVDDLWKGPYSIQGNFFEASCNYRSFRIKAGTKDYDAFMNERYGLSEYKEEKYKSNFTHFKVWRKNIYLKYYFELVITFLILCLYQIIAIVMMYCYYSMIKTDASYVSQLSIYVEEYLKNSTDFLIAVNSNNASNLNQYESIIFNNVTDLYTDFNYKANIISVCYPIIVILSLGFLGFPLGYLTRFIFAVKSSTPNYGGMVYTDFSLFVTVLVTILTWSSSKMEKLQSIASSYNSTDIIQNKYFTSFEGDVNTYSGQDPLHFEFTLMSIICTILWLKCFIMLRGTKTFGPLIVIFILAIKGIFIYLILFFIMTLIYACFGILNFYSVNDYFYKNFYYTFIYYTLVSTGGEPNFAEYDDPNITTKNYYPWAGGIIIILLVILNSVVFFNIIIALLTNIYEDYKSYAIQLYIQQKLNIRKKFYSEDERFDSLLVSVFPLDIITFPFAVIFLFIKGKETVLSYNTFLLKLYFYIYAMFYLLLYISLTATMLPVVYIKILVSKIFQLFVEEIQEYFLIYKLVNILAFTFFGWFLLIKTYVVDIIIFMKLLEKKKIPLLTENENEGKYSISGRTIKIILSLFKLNNVSEQISNEGIKLSLERFLYILSKTLEGKLSIIELQKQIISFDLSDIKALKKYEEEMEDFNINNNEHKNKINKLKSNYNEILDFMLNFCDEMHILDTNTVYNILKASKKAVNHKNYFKDITDKSYNINQTINQNVFVKKVSKYLSSTKTLNAVKINDNNIDGGNLSNINREVISHNVNNSNNNLIENKVLNYTNIEKTDKIIDITSNNTLYNSEIGIISKESPDKRKLYDSIKSQHIVESSPNYSKEGDSGDKPVRRKSIYKMALSKAKNRREINLKLFGGLFKFMQDKIELNYTYLIPVVSRNTIDAFMNDLKEYQTDMTKKISENLLKNQKMLSEITNKSRENEDLKKMKDEIGLHNIKNSFESSFNNKQEFEELENRLEKVERQNNKILKLLSSLVPSNSSINGK